MSRKRFLRLMGLWPKGSEETVDGAFGPEGCGRLTAAGCVRFAQGATAAVPQRVVEAPYGRNIKSALRDLHLCHYGSLVISSGGTSRYESHSFVEPVKGSPEISL